MRRDGFSPSFSLLSKVNAEDLDDFNVNFVRKTLTRIKAERSLCFVLKYRGEALYIRL